MSFTTLLWCVTSWFLAHWVGKIIHIAWRSFAEWEVRNKGHTNKKKRALNTSPPKHLKPLALSWPPDRINSKFLKNFSISKVLSEILQDFLKILSKLPPRFFKVPLDCFYFFKNVYDIYLQLLKISKTFFFNFSKIPLKFESKINFLKFSKFPTSLYLLKNISVLVDWGSHATTYLVR